MGVSEEGLSELRAVAPRTSYAIIAMRKPPFILPYIGTKCIRATPNKQCLHPMPTFRLLNTPLGSFSSIIVRLAYPSARVTFNQRMRTQKSPQGELWVNVIVGSFRPPHGHVGRHFVPLVLLDKEGASCMPSVLAPQVFYRLRFFCAVGRWQKEQK